jgi:hypothetical protein
MSLEAQAAAQSDQLFFLVWYGAREQVSWERKLRFGRTSIAHGRDSVSKPGS